MRHMSVKISSKYQVVIPENVREELKIRPGMEVDVIAKGGIAYIVPIHSLSQVSESVKDYLVEGDVKSLRDKKDRKL